MTHAEEIVLHRGALKFTAFTAGSGPLVLCLHGFPDNARSFRHQLPCLAEAGFRAVSVTLRGYEPSSQGDDPDYALDTLAKDVVAFIGELGEKTAHLVGHDWGAAIAYVAGALDTRRFRSLTTLSVAHSGRFLNEAIHFPRQLRKSWYMFFFQLRGIADHAVKRNDFRFIRNLWLDWSPGWEFSEEEFQDVIATFRQPGVTKAALSYYRTALAPRTFTPKARAAIMFQVPVPTMAMIGERDGCMDAGVFDQLMREEDFPAGLEVRHIAHAGHFPHQEQHGAVNRLLLEWLDRWTNSSHQEELNG
jgi:pimeloyl-ACP methyl ester carboxylesterase